MGSKNNTAGKPQNPFNRAGASFITLGVIGLIYNGWSAFRADDGKHFIEYFFSTQISFGRSGVMPEFLALVLVYGPFVALAIGALLYLVGLSRRAQTQAKVAEWEAQQRAAHQAQWDAQQASQATGQPHNFTAPQQPQQPQPQQSPYGAAPQQPQSPYGTTP